MVGRNEILRNSQNQNSLNTTSRTRNIYWGEVISIDDETESGRIKIRVPEFDKKIGNTNLVWSYPILPKFFHIYPKIGEVVRILIEDTTYPQRNRFWIGSVISQLQKIKDDNIYTALSSTPDAVLKPDVALSKTPTAKGVFPEIEDVALIGRDNTDVILRENEIELRAGKHNRNDVTNLNVKNPSSIKLSFDYNKTTNTNVSNNIIMADKIALISHDGTPNFKKVRVDQTERERIFEQGHPIGRGDVIVEAFEIIRQALLTHIHPYDKLPVDKSGIIIDLEKIDFNAILQRNIVTN